MIQHIRKRQFDQSDSREGRIVQAVHSDIETITNLGDWREFSERLRRDVPDAWRDEADIPFRSQWDEVEDAAVAIFGTAMDPATVRRECHWRRNHRRLLQIANLVRAEAERLRDDASKRGAR